MRRIKIEEMDRRFWRQFILKSPLYIAAIVGFWIATLVAAASVWPKAKHEAEYEWAWAMNHTPVVLLSLVILALLWTLGLQLFKEPKRLLDHSDRQRNVAVLQYALVAHNAVMYKLRNVATDEALDEVEREFKAVCLNAVRAIFENVGMGAASKYGSGTEESFAITWAGEHSPEHLQKLTTMLQRLKLRIQNIEEMLASDKWDDPIPLSKRKGSKEWELLNQEFGKMLADG